MQQDLTPKQQTSEAIRQAETILILTGQHPTVDQVTAVLALSAVLRKVGKKVSTVISDPLPQQVQFLDASVVSQSLSGLRDFIVKLDLQKAEIEKVGYEISKGKLNVYITPFQGSFAPSDVTFGYGDYHFDLVIVLGVPTRARIDRVFADNQSFFSNIPVLNLDYHRSNESFGAVNLIEPTASSLCEILVALSESLQTGLIDADIATIMLTGLISSTDRFTASHTTSKSMTVAAQLMAAGARQQSVVKGLYRDSRDSSDRQSARADQPRGDRAARSDNRPQAQPRPEPVRQTPTPDHNRPAARPEPVQPKETPIQPQAPKEQFEPIIDPSHIEMSPMNSGEPFEEQLTAEFPAMADFAAAAQLLRRNDDDNPAASQPAEKPHEQSRDSKADTSPAPSADNSSANSTQESK